MSVKGFDLLVVLCWMGCLNYKVGVYQECYVIFLTVLCLQEQLSVMCEESDKKYYK